MQKKIRYDIESFNFPTDYLPQTCFGNEGYEFFPILRIHIISGRIYKPYYAIMMSRNTVQRRHLTSNHNSTFYRICERLCTFITNWNIMSVTYSTYFENPLFMMSNVMSLNDDILDWRCSVWRSSRSVPTLTRRRSVAVRQCIYIARSFLIFS